MPRPELDFLTIQRRACDWYRGQPIQVLMTPIRNQVILEVLNDAEDEGWVQIISTESTNFIPNQNHTNANQAVLEEAVKRLASGEGEVFLSDPLDPKPIFMALLRKDFGLRKEGEIWSHLAAFEWQRYGNSDSSAGCDLLLVSDGVLGTKYNLVRRIGVIQNTVTVAHFLGISQPNIALLAASHSIQQDVQTSREWAWVSKMSQRGIFHQANVFGPVGLEEVAQSGGYPVDALITADISVGNPLVSALNLLCGLPCAGIIMGGEVPVVLPWPLIDKTSVLTSLALAALCSPRGLQRLKDIEVILDN
jgi:phosphate butyryltransferase